MSIIDLLRMGAEEQCNLHIIQNKNNNNQIPSRSERKLKERRKKACSSIHTLLNRIQQEDHTSNSKNNINQFATSMLYRPFSECIRDRANKRKHWENREKDSVFYTIEKDCRPIPFPVQFDMDTTKKPNIDSNDNIATTICYTHSPLIGKHSCLISIAENLQAWGKCFDTKNATFMPKKTLRYAAIRTNQDDNKGETNSGKFSHISEQDSSSAIQTSNEYNPIECDDRHKKNLQWNGWESQRKFGLEMQEPWAGHLLSGLKQVETRAYPLPPSLIGKRIEILESKSGIDGVSALANIIQDQNLCINRIGWCTFEHVIEYKNQNDFEADEKRHLVESKSGYGWISGVTHVLYGWKVGKYESYNESSPQLDNASHCLERRMRSIFEFVDDMKSNSRVTIHNSNKSGKKRKNLKSYSKQCNVNGKKKKKRRY